MSDKFWYKAFTACMVVSVICITSKALVAGTLGVVDYVTVITMGFLSGLGFGGLVLGPRVVVHNFVFHDGDDGRDGRG